MIDDEKLVTPDLDLVMAAAAIFEPRKEKRQIDARMKELRRIIEDADDAYEYAQALVEKDDLNDRLDVVKTAVTAAEREYTATRRNRAYRVANKAASSKK